MTYNKYLLLCFSLFIGCSMIAQTHIWTGNGGDINWFNPANWDVGTMPSTNSSVLIPDGFSVEIRTNVTNVNAIELEGSALLTIANDITLGSELFISLLSEVVFESGLISGGIIENGGTLTVEGFSTHAFDDVIINNTSLFLITESNQTLFINSTINNLSGGILDIPSNGGLIQQASQSTLNNAGIVRKTQGSSGNGSYYLILEINNTGLFDVAENQMFLLLAGNSNFTILEEGIMSGFGVYDITANFTNMGTVYPGNIDEVGTLNITNFFSLNGGTIVFDIAGVQNGEFDQIAVFGSPNVSGFIEINLSYAAQIDEEFTVITATHGMNTCDFPAEITSIYDGMQYQFEVNCNPNDLTLKVIDVEVLGTTDFNSHKLNFYAIPNPVISSARFEFSSEEISLITEETSIEIYNFTGQYVKSIPTIAEKNVPFNRENLASGLYFARLVSNGKTLATTKILLQ